jgi:hypothetical protein
MKGARRRTRCSWLPAPALGALLIAGWLQACGPGPPRPTANSEAGKTQGRVSPELWSLYEAYEESRRSGADFPPRDVLARIVEDRVVIDAAAAANDVETLRVDLEALGLQGAAVFGRMVSGELPVTAIPALATLSSLRFAAPASAIQRGKSVAPPRPRSTD